MARPADMDIMYQKMLQNAPGGKTMEKRVKKKKVCPKCREPIYLVGTSVDESYKILTCKNKECEHYMRILKQSQSKEEDSGE